MKVLLVESDLAVRRSISDLLVREKFIVEEVGTFNEAQEKVNLYTYDCVILEIILPDGDGFDLITQLKQKDVDLSILVVSESNVVEDKIRGLNVGADDYVAKPFNLEELDARIKSVLRRRKFHGCQEILFHEIRVNLESRQVFVNQSEMILTPKEYHLLLFLMINKNRVLTRVGIVEHLWGDMMGLNADSLDFLNSHIRNLRYKIRKAGGHDYIHTVYSVGYKFTDL